MGEEVVVAEVISSKCQHYKVGDKIVLNGPLIDVTRSNNICVTALLSFYPMLFGLRKKVNPEQILGAEKVIVQCPEHAAPVIFELKGE